MRDVAADLPGTSRPSLEAECAASDEVTEPAIHPDLLTPSRPMSPAVPVFVTAVVACWTLATMGNLTSVDARFGLCLAAGALAVGIARLGSWRRASSQTRMVLAAVGASISCSIAGAVLLRRDAIWELAFPSAEEQPMAAGLPGIFVDGVVLGLARAAAMAPIALVLYRVISSVGRARAGTLCDGADRRAAWSATAAIALLFFALFGMYRVVVPLRTTELQGLTKLMVLRWFGVEPAEYLAITALGLVALAVVVMVLVLDAWALVRCLRITGSPDAPRWRTVGGSYEQLDARCVDLGVGEQRWARVEQEGDPYRGLQRARVAMVGDPELARGILGWALLRDVALALGCGALVVGLLSW